MKRIIFIFILFGWCATALCQTGKITGSVMDAENKIALELATISIFGQDSSLVTYQLSDKNGKFTIEKLPLRKKLLVSVTYTGYVGQNRAVELQNAKADTLSFFLQVNNKDTNAVIVTATIPIRMNGDTLEINPAAFKLKEHAVVEELLNQVSGITMWSDGTITVNGKLVSNVFVDGKPFMGSSDSRVVTQNLPKSAIDKIQLYQEYDRSNIGRDPQPQDSLLTMNIQLKEGSKKGYFGKGGAGYGTTDRFESDLSFQVYNKKSSIGIGGGFNNINKNIGNLQEMFRNNTFRNINPNLYNVGRFGASGINKNHSIGGVLTHSFIETANSRQNNRVVVNYNKSGTDSYVTDLNLQSRPTINNPLFIRTEGVQNNAGNRHEVGVNYARTNSFNDNLNISGNINSSNDKGTSSRFTETRDSANRLQSTNGSTSVQNRRSDNESLNVSFARSDNENPLKSFNLSVNARRGNSVSERDVTSIFESFTDATKNTSLNRHYTSNNQSLNVGGNLQYSGFKRLLLGRFNLFGVELNFSQRFNYNRVSDDASVSDYDSVGKRYIDNDNLSNFNKRELLEWAPTLMLSKSFFKYSDGYYRNWNLQLRFLDDIRTEKNQSSIVKRNLVRSFQFLRYEGGLNYNYQKREKYQYFAALNYSRNFEYPSIDQLYTIVDNINFYDIRVGNPNLTNTTNHSFNLNVNFNTQKPKAVYTINSNIGAGYSLSLNPVTDSIINDLSGKRTSYYINADSRRNLNLNYNLNISRKFGKNNLQLMYNGQLGSGMYPNYIDTVRNITETGTLNNQFSVQFSLSSVFVLTVGQGFQHSKSTPTSPRLRAFKNNSSTTRWGVVLNYPENFSFSSTLDHVSNSNLSKPTILWNSFATYRFMKQQAELKFSAMDLLKQYQNISNSVSVIDGTTTTRITNGLQQYFLLTLSYYPRKFGKTEIRRPTQNRRR